MRTIDDRRRRLAIARAATRLELGFGALAILLALFIMIAAPGFHQWLGPQPRIEVIGIVGIVVGFAWMLRIRLADSASGAPPWRHRSDLSRD